MTMLLHFSYEDDDTTDIHDDFVGGNCDGSDCNDNGDFDDFVNGDCRKEKDG
jgi:hypothetical protein